MPIRNFTVMRRQLLTAKLIITDRLFAGRLNLTLLNLLHNLTRKSTLYLLVAGCQTCMFFWYRTLLIQHSDRSITNQRLRSSGPVSTSRSCKTTFLKGDPEKEGQSLLLNQEILTDHLSRSEPVDFRGNYVD
jgi:hypothetical protein